MSRTFADWANLESLGDHQYRGRFPPSFNQGPGCYGGLIAATLGALAEREVPKRPVRAVSMHLCAPLRPEPFEVTVRPARAGSFVSFLTAEIRQGSGPAVIASLTLGGTRTDAGDFARAPMPRLPEPSSMFALPSMPGAPAFLEHFDMLFAKGIPFTGVADPVSGGWLRPRVPQALGTPSLLAMLDAWPLAILPTFKGLKPAASVVIQFQLYPPFPEVAEDAWYAVDVESELQHQGYSEQSGSIWTRTGRLVGRSHQLVARLSA